MINDYEGKHARPVGTKTKNLLRLALFSFMLGAISMGIFAVICK